jgi:hypothetical protein
LSSAHDVPSTNDHSPSPSTSERRPAIVTAPGRIESSDALEAASPARSVCEVLGSSLIPALVGARLAPADPLLIHGSFPWLVLVPLLVGVQHGALAATLSSGLLLSVGGIQLLVAGQQGAVPGLAAFAGGCLAVGIIAGHFHDRVQGRLARLSQQAADAARRLSRLSRAHAVVKLSHQKLEQRLAAGNWSLVSAFEDARRELGEATSLSAVGEVVLNVLSNHAMVQSATLLAVVSVDRRGRIELRPSASIGAPPATDLQHRLILRALATGRLVALDSEAADGDAKEQTVLAVAPLVAASGKVLGLISIHEMPFMAFQAESLKGLAALTALLADMLEDHFAKDLGVAEQDAEARSGEQHLSLVPERALSAVPVHEQPIEPVSAESGPPADSEVVVAGSAEGDDLDTAHGDEFVGTRTGTHRRRGVAQSA